MKFKFNPITGVFDRISNEGELKEQINPLTGEFNLAPDADSYKQVFNPLTGKRNLALAAILAEVTGNGYLNLTRAVRDSLQELKAYGGIELRSLPSGYTQIEYINFSGGQYIDTNVVISNASRASGMFSLNDITITDLQYIVGTRNTGGKAIGFALNAPSRGGFTSYVFAWLDSSDTYYTISSDTEKVVFDNTVRNNELILKINNNVTYSDSSFSGGDYTGDKTYYIGALINSSNTGVQYKLYGKVYSVVLYNDNNEIVFNGIPAKRNSDNTLGMYDTVSNTFLINIGTGEFTAGPDVVPTPEAPMNIVCNNGVLKVSKNLFNYEYFYDNYVQPTSSTVGRVVIKLLPNTTYTISTNTEQSSTAAQVWTASGDDPNTFAPVTSSNGVLVNSPRTIQSDNNGNIILALRVGTDYEIKESDFENGTVWVQIEQGSTATSYMPYGIYTDGTIETITDELGNTATCQPLLKLLEYQDVQSILDGVVTRNVGIKVFNGTEEFNNRTLTNCYTCEDLLGPGTFTNRTVYCTHFASSPELPEASNREGLALIGNDSTGYKVGFGVVNTFSTIDAFKQFLADQYANGTPVIVVYPLATPTTESVAGQTMNVKKGANTIEITQASIDDLPLSAKYLHI